MQRIIKFRAWDGQKMLYPKDYNYIHFTEGCQSWEVFTEDEMHEYFIAATNGNHVDGLEDSALMQFTGLTDKNGKEIYEGDIVEHGMGGGIIEWIEPYACFKLNENGELCNPEITCQVIGNIHENPELCKG